MQQSTNLKRRINFNDIAFLFLGLTKCKKFTIWRERKTMPIKLILTLPCNGGSVTEVTFLVTLLDSSLFISIIISVTL